MKFDQIEPTAPRMIETGPRRFAVARCAVIVDSLLVTLCTIFVRIDARSRDICRSVVAIGATLFLVAIRALESKQLRVVAVMKRGGQLLAGLVQISALWMKCRMF